jgi:hypothetical protein
MNNEIRTGRITSSEIVALVSEGRAKDSFGAPFYTYVSECVMERMFGLSLENKVTSIQMQWGKLLESWVHKHLLGLEYIMQSRQTLIHPTIREWAGSPDQIKMIGDEIETVTDIKCPFTRKSFFCLVQSIYKYVDGVVSPSGISGNDAIKEVRKTKDGEKYYWQLVSNACITGAKYAELIVYMPYLEDLQEIEKFNYNADEEEKSFRVAWAKENELPYIVKESGFKDLNIIRFEVPQEDKDFLTNRVNEAVKLINENYIKL